LVVRVKVRIKAVSTGSSAEVVALANSGYETETPEIAMPRNLADRLGLRPQEASRDFYMTAGGPIEVLRFPEAIEITVLAGDREEGPVLADAIVMETDEVLLGDKVLGALKLDLVDPARGLWRFRDEPSDVLRQRAEREHPSSP